MYLYIFDDGLARMYKEVNEDDLRASDDGYFTIFDISDPECVKEYYNLEWNDVEVSDETT